MRSNTASPPRRRATPGGAAGDLEEGVLEPRHRGTEGAALALAGDRLQLPQPGVAGVLHVGAGLGHDTVDGQQALAVGSRLHRHLDAMALEQDALQREGVVGVWRKGHRRHRADHPIRAGRLDAQRLAQTPGARGERPATAAPGEHHFLTFQGLEPS